MSTNNDNINAVSEQGGYDSVPLSPQKFHHMTVCMVPPPEADFVWKTVGDMRRQLKDPGFYRWPPHANLLYPFFETKDYDDAHAALEENLLNALQRVATQVEPFTVRLDKLGTFGGKQRGVLWLAPDSYPTSATVCSSNQENEGVQPLLQLHKALEKAFPMCKDQAKGGSSFTPHLTLSHFANLDDALAAKQVIEKDYNQELPKLEFQLDRIYLLRRAGDGGQFLRIAEFGLGKFGNLHNWETGPRPFPDMPTEEADWVYEERMKLKARRKGGQRPCRGGSMGSRRSVGPRRERVPDSPEVIAAKRAERKAKREQLLKREEDTRESRNQSSKC
jgi:2'-5' RNA ligase